jgi:hypothetical protein
VKATKPDSNHCFLVMDVPLFHPFEFLFWIVVLNSCRSSRRPPIGGCGLS